MKYYSRNWIFTKKVNGVTVEVCKKEFKAPNRSKIWRDLLNEVNNRKEVTQVGFEAAE